MSLRVSHPIRRLPLKTAWQEQHKIHNLLNVPRPLHFHYLHFLVIYDVPRCFYFAFNYLTSSGDLMKNNGLLKARISPERACFLFVDRYYQNETVCEGNRRKRKGKKEEDKINCFCSRQYITENSHWSLFGNPLLRLWRRTTLCRIFETRIFSWHSGIVQKSKSFLVNLQEIIMKLEWAGTFYFAKMWRLQVFASLWLNYSLLLGYLYSPCRLD